MANKVLKTAVGSSAAFTAACYLVFYEVMERDSVIPQLANKIMKNNRPAGAAQLRPEDNDERKIWFNNQKPEIHSIRSDAGNNLKGYLYKPENPSKVFVFGSHGYRSNRGEFRLMTKYYHDKGYNVFLVEHQAAGRSEGKYIGFGYHEYKDCLKWLDYLIKTYGDDIEIILHGVSMGSATVMLMSGYAFLPKNVKFTVADCGYTSAWSEFEHNLKSMGVLKYPVLYGSNFFNKRINGYDFKDADALYAVKNARVPMLFIHGSKDDFVPTYMGVDLYNACNAPYKDFLLVEGAAHAESFKVDSEDYEAKINEFIEKFI